MLFYHCRNPSSVKATGRCTSRKRAKSVDYFLRILGEKRGGHVKKTEVLKY